MPKKTLFLFLIIVIFLIFFYYLDRGNKIMTGWLEKPTLISPTNEIKDQPQVKKITVAVTPPFALLTVKAQRIKIVKISNKNFDENFLSVLTGETIHFVNQSKKEEKIMIGDAGPFKINPSQTFIYSFTNSGSYKVELIGAVSKMTIVVK